MFAYPSLLRRPPLPATANESVSKFDLLHRQRLNHLQALEAESLYILREAVAEANSAPPGTSVAVALPAGAYMLNHGRLTIDLAENSALTINGSGAGRSTIDGNHALQVLAIRTGGLRPQPTAARLRGQEYLLERRMLRRLSTGEVIDPDWTHFSYPTYWHYDVLRGLDHMRTAGVAPDERMTEAIELVESRRDADGRWPLENQYPGRTHFAMDEGPGRPSRWNTLRAMRVLRWYAAGAA